MYLNSEDVIKKRVARKILSTIEAVCFSEEFRECIDKHYDNLIQGLELI